ncbi:hypothetical protein WJX84_004718 [Apatococcus fuscideae]|uniref:cellulase n=1 Tax=Apatococcus fuscideae TaxID=2026836 RepID=A0AAW1TDV0_9CHLO
MAICCPGVVVVCAVLTSYLGVTTAAGVVGNVAPYNYAEALHKALLYYQIQRSGTLPYQRLAWRSDSCTACKGTMGEDLSGGYWEAGGSYLKVAFPQAFVITQLAWAATAFPSGFTATGEMGELLGAIRWGADFIMASMPNAIQYVALYGNSQADFLYYGPPEAYEANAPDGGSRTVTYVTPADPSSETAGEGAAALAAAAVAFQASDPAYALALTTKAKALYALAKNNPGSFMTSTTSGLQDLAKLYPSTGYHDELGWAALWLFQATNSTSYLTDATGLFAAVQGDANSGGGFQVFGWDVKTPGYNVLLASLQPSNMQAVAAANAFFQAYIPGSMRTVPHTANGLAYPWQGAGSLRTASNTAMLGFIHARTLQAMGGFSSLADQIMSYSLSQLNFVLGDSGRSWLVGFGKNPPQQSFQKTAWNSYITWFTKGQSVDAQRSDFQDTLVANRFIAYGALVGGPFDQSGVTYQDRRLNYTFVEPAVDYSSGLVGAIAFAAQYYGGQVPFTDCGLDLGWSDPHAGPRQAWPGTDCYHQCCNSSAALVPTTPATALAASASPSSVSTAVAGRRRLFGVPEPAAESLQDAVAMDEVEVAGNARAAADDETEDCDNAGLGIETTSASASGPCVRPTRLFGPCEVPVSI